MTETLKKQQKWKSRNVITDMPKEQVKKKPRNYWITSGYEGVEILVPMDDQDSYALLDEDADEVLHGESDEEITDRLGRNEQETKIDNLIVHVPTKLKYWEDEMVEADLGEEKRYHHATNMYLRFKELNDIGVENLNFKIKVS